MEISPKQLEEMLARLVAEARKPAELRADEKEALENKLRAQESDRAMREQQARLVLQQMENKRLERESCSHTRQNGTTSAVYVENGNYLICQQCQGIIRPGAAPKDYHGGDIYDTLLFNKLFQLQTPSIF